MSSENPADSPTPPSPNSHKNTDDKQSHPPRETPSRSEMHIEPSHAHCEITCNEKRDGWDRAKMGAEFVGIIFLIIYTLYTAGIYCANRRAANAAKTSAEASIRQVAAYEVSQRPWMEVANPGIYQDRQHLINPPAIPPGQPIVQGFGYQFTASLKNYGATPALHSYSKANPRFVDLAGNVGVFLENVPVPVLDSCSVDAKWEKSDVAYFPSGSYQLLSNSQTASGDEMTALMHFRKALFWIGCTRYEDAFKRRYQTNFCFHWDVSEGWGRCLSGNDLIEYPTH